MRRARRSWLFRLPSSTGNMETPSEAAADPHTQSPPPSAGVTRRHFIRSPARRNLSRPADDHRHAQIVSKCCCGKSPDPRGDFFGVVSLVKKTATLLVRPSFAFDPAVADVAVEPRMTAALFFSGCGHDSRNGASVGTCSVCRRAERCSSTGGKTDGSGWPCRLVDLTKFSAAFVSSRNVSPRFRRCSDTAFRQR